MNKDIYFDKGVVIRLLGNDFYMIHPDNVENNLEALDDGKLIINWKEALEISKKFTKLPTKNRLEIIIFGRLVASIEAFSYKDLYQLLTSENFKINWLELFKSAKSNHKILI